MLSLMDLDEIAQNRLDAQEVSDVSAIVTVERQIEEPAKLIRDYRHRFNQKRRELIRDALTELIDDIDAKLRRLKILFPDSRSNESVGDPDFDVLKQNVTQISMSLGAAYRNLHAGLTCIGICVLE
jgi:hypothetical protein